MHFLKVLVACLALIATTYGQAGIKAKLNSEAYNSAISLLERLPLSIQLNDFLRNVSFLNILVQNIYGSSLRATSFDFGQHALRQLDEDSYRFDITSGGTNFTALYDYRLYIRNVLAANATGPLFFGYNFSSIINFDLMLRENGLPRLHFETCRVEVHDSNIHNAPDDFPSYNIFRLFEVLIDTDLSEHLQNQICNVVLPNLEFSVNFLLGRVSSQVQILPQIPVTFNASLYENPSVAQDSSVEASLDGTFYPSNQPNITFPYPRLILPEFTSSSSMVQIIVGEYVLDTLYYSLTSANISNTPFPLDSVSFGGMSLDADVLSFIFPDIRSFAAGRTLGFTFAFSGVPNIDLRESGLSMNADVDLILVGVDSNGTSEVAAILTLRMETTGFLIINNSTISGNLTDIQINVVVKKSQVGNANLVAINSLLSQDSFRSQFLPAVNGVLGSGVEIPTSLGLGFAIEDINARLIDHAALVSFNFAYPSEFGRTPEQFFNFLV